MRPLYSRLAPLIFVAYVLLVGAAVVGYYFYGKHLMGVSAGLPMYAQYDNELALAGMKFLGLPWSLVEWGHVWNADGDPDFLLLELACLINAALLFGLFLKLRHHPNKFR
jgi:hypothetical protein